MSPIAPYLNQTLQLEARTGHDATGQPTYGAAASYAARVQPTRRLVRNAQGEQVAADLEVWLDPSATVAEGARATYDGGTYEVLSVRRQFSFDYLSHFELTLGRR